MTYRTRDRPPDRRAGSLPAGVLALLERQLPGRRWALAGYVVLSLVAALITVTTLLALLDWVLPGAIQRLDDAVLQWVADRQDPAWVEVALDVTALGNTLTVAIVVACVAAFLWLDGRRLDVAVLVVGGVTGRLATEFLKALFDRPRPEILEWGTHVTAAALPSAHAVSATLAYGAIAYLAGGRAGPGLRGVLWVVASIAIVAVSASRVYLGVHYPTDVIAGVTMGALWMTFALSALPACARQTSGANIPVSHTRRRA